MTIKVVVAQRSEGLNQQGEITCTVGMMTENGPIKAKIEVGGLTVEQAANFPVKRVMEITLPTYSKEKNRIITLEQPA